MTLLKSPLLFLVFLVLAGCEGVIFKRSQITPLSTEHKEPDVVVAPGSAAVTSAPLLKSAELTPDIIFNLLAGEVAAQRGDLEQAYSFQLKAATLAGDPRAAERATRLAIHMEQPDLATAAVRSWVELAPNELAARQLAVVLLLRQDPSADVLDQLKAIVTISDARNENGFLNAMAAVNRELKRDKAINLMRALTKEFPGDPRGRYALAITALVEKDYASAEAEAKALIESDPDWFKAYLVLGRVYVAQGEKAKARQLLADALVKHPDEIVLVSAYARMLVDAKELQQAYDQFRLLDRLDPEQGGATYWLGLLALELGREKEAKGYFLKLIEKRQQTDVAAFYLGQIEEKLAHPERAIAWYEQVGKGEYSQVAQARIVHLMTRDGGIHRALEWLRDRRIQGPRQSVRLYLMEAELLKEHGSAERVMALYAEALKVHPDDNSLLYARGLFAVTQGRLDILEQDLQKVIENDPQHADALNALGYSLTDRTDRHEEALGYIQRALELKPDSPVILDSMGWVLFRMGKYQASLGYLKQAFEQLKDPEIAAHLGEVLWITGDREHAQKIWKAALQEEPHSEHILEVMRRFNP